MTNILGAFALLLMPTLPTLAADYDLVILNGRVMDPETMLDAVMNVGVKDGRIGVITKDEITGKERINAEGLDAPPMVCRNNDYDWWEIEEKLPAARARGMNMWSEYYPYAAAAAASSEINAEHMKPEIFEGFMSCKCEKSAYGPDKGMSS